MNKLSLTPLLLLSALTALPAKADESSRPDCAFKAERAAKMIHHRINADVRLMKRAQTTSDSATAQVVEIVFDSSGGGASVTYSVEIERNPSPIVANQLCARVVRLALVGEE